MGGLFTGSWDARGATNSSRSHWHLDNGTVLYDDSDEFLKDGWVSFAGEVHAEYTPEQLLTWQELYHIAQADGEGASMKYAHGHGLLDSLVPMELDHAGDSASSAFAATPSPQRAICVCPKGAQIVRCASEGDAMKLCVLRVL